MGTGVKDIYVSNELEYHGYYIYDSNTRNVYDQSGHYVGNTGGGIVDFIPYR